MNRDKAREGEGNGMGMGEGFIFPEMHKMTCTEHCAQSYLLIKNDGKKFKLYFGTLISNYYSKHFGNFAVWNTKIA